MIKLLADKAEMEAFERAEKKEEIANEEPVSSSVLSPISSASVLNGETQPNDVAKSSRYQKPITREQILFCYVLPILSWSEQTTG